MTLLELLALMRKHLRLVVILPVVCAVVMAAYSYLFMPNTYTASVSMYVLATNEEGSSALNSELSASQMLTNDVATLLKSDRVSSQTAEDLGLKSLSAYEVSVSSSTTSRLITLSVTGTDAAGTSDVANGMAENVSTIAHDVMGIEAVNIIDRAATPESPSGPKRPLYVAVALLAGLFAAIAVIVLVDMLDTRVRNEKDVEELLGIPVIGRVPAMKGGR